MAQYGNYQEPEPPLVFNRIYIGGALGISDHQLRETFGQFGPIQEIYVMKNRRGEEQGNVFMSFEKTSEACLALENMDGQQIYNSPRILKVEIAKEKERNSAVEINYDHVEEHDFLHRVSYTYDKSMSQIDLRQYFSQWGSVIKLYQANSKNPNHKKGRGWIRFARQSEAAMCLEQADESYRVNWYDVRRSKPDDMMQGYARQQDSNWAPRGSGGRRIKYDNEGNLDYHSLTGLTEEDLDFLPGFEKEDPSVGPDTLEAMTPPGMTKEMVKGLFDLVPGMEECKLDTRTGIARIKYSSGQCTAYAKEKLDGFSYANMPVQVKFGRQDEVESLRQTGAELKATMDTMLQNGTSDTTRLHSIMQSLQMITETLKKQGVSLDDKSSKSKDIPWCSAALPSRKPLLAQCTPVVGRLFLVATPEAFYDKILYNVFCRFGDLIRVGFEKGKRFGFAHYGSQQAADAAKKALHGHYIFSSKLKVEYASEPKVSGGDSGHSKRSRVE